MGEVKALSFDLPWPPSVNNYYRHVGPRVLISRAGRRYRSMVVSRLGGLNKLSGRLSLYAELYPPDRRRRDIDNINKVVFDSLQDAGLYSDDSQIKELHLLMLEPMPPDGLIHIELKETDNERQNIRACVPGLRQELHAPPQEKLEVSGDMQPGVPVAPQACDGSSERLFSP